MKKYNILETNIHIDDELQTEFPHLLPKRKKSKNLENGKKKRKTSENIDKSINQIGFLLQLFIPIRRENVFMVSELACEYFISCFFASFSLSLFSEQTEQFRRWEINCALKLKGTSLVIRKLAFFKHFAREWVALILASLLSCHVLSLPSTFPFLRSAPPSTTFLHF